MLTDSQCRSAKCRHKPYELMDGKGLYPHDANNRLFNVSAV